ncbi:MAG TPA: hypothetical protein VD905_13575 [Flavobacteriales bacterium]|nr:hypothetical protein [Flavobacteriales bacterium]
MKLDFVEPVLTISQKPAEEKKTFIKKILTYRYSRLLYRAYKRVHKLNWQQARELPHYLKPVETIVCTINKKGIYSEYFSVGDIETIRSYKLDFIIRFGFNIIRGDILDAARYGVWSYHHGDEEKYRGGPPAFWEVHRNEHVCGTILQRLTNKLDSGIVLKKGYFGVTNHSYNATLGNVYAQSASWIKQVCIDLQNGVAHYLNNAPSNTTAKVYTYPGNFTMLLFGLRKIGRKLRFHWHDLFRPESWLVGLIQNETGFEPGKKLSKQITWFNHASKSAYYADGFVVLNDRYHYLFVEEYDYATGKGVIASFDLQTCKKQTLIEEPHHLSYPFSFVHNGKIYVLPEAAGSGKITLYVVNPLSNLIVSKTVLMENVHAYDPTLFEYAGKWWLFVTHKETGSNTSLHIYYAQHLTGPYAPHANNPVKTDIGSARPAGNIFCVNGVYYRPAQNCSRTYGGSVVIHKIIRLNEYVYHEEKHDEILPNQVHEKATGIHTLTTQGKLVAFDLKRPWYNGANFRKKLAKKLKLSK